MIITTSVIENFLPLLIIAFGIFLSLLIVAWRRSQCFILIFTVVIFISALAATSKIIFTAPEQVTLLLNIDNYSRFAYCLILVTSIVIAFLSSLWLHHNDEEHDEYYILLQLVTLGAGVLVFSSHFASLFLGFELLSIALVGLVGYNRRAEYSIESAFKYLILSACASSFMLLGIAFIYSQVGSLYFLDVGGTPSIAANNQSYNILYTTGFLLFIVGIAFKLSIAPFHLWAPDVYQGAPIPVTLLLASVSKVAIFVVFIRFWFSTEQFSNSYLVNTLSLLAAISMLLGNILALKQQNIKRLLAYSSIAHMGYLAVTLLILSVDNIHFAWQSALFYLSAYVLATISLFVALQLTQLKEINQNEELSHWRGLFWRQRNLAILIIISVLSLAGIPLSMGFIGKFYLLNLAVQAKLWTLIVILIIGSGIALCYYLRVVFYLFESKGFIFIAEGNASKISFNSVSLNVLINIGVIMLMCLNFFFGIYPEFIINTIKEL